MASIVFTTGVLMCIFLGGNLFTSNCLITAPLITGKIKIRIFIFDITIILLGNLIGTLIMAAFTWGVGIFGDLSIGDENNQAWAVWIFAEHKMTWGWWKSFLSSILCNVLIAGSMIAYLAISDRVVGIVMVFVMIISFCLGSYQNVVADSFVTLLGVFIGAEAGILTNSVLGQMFYNCLIPSTIGNILGGLLITYVFYYSVKPNKNRFKFSPKIVSCKQNTDGSEACVTTKASSVGKLPKDYKIYLKNEKSVQIMNFKVNNLNLKANFKIENCKKKILEIENIKNYTKDQVWIEESLITLNKLDKKITKINVKLENDINNIKSKVTRDTDEQQK